MLFRSVLSHNARDGRPPRIVAELGPGLSLGVGLAALICGAERYVALDIVRFAPMASVLPIFERLLGLFTARAKPENAHGFPPYDTLLDASGFPSEILPDARVAALLAPARIEALRRDVQGFVASGGKPSRRLHYAAPWRLADTPHRGEVDFLLSHTVLQHVGDIHAEWQNIGGMLRSGGVCSHQINFDSHGTATAWNGHWTYPDALWRIALGRKSFLINREPLSRQLAAARAAGLTPALVLQRHDAGGVSRAALSRPWQGLIHDDLHTRGAFVVARKD